ncbi:MAG TPA: hypothetical protein VM688_03565 [Nocardioidaceae bacterium]|nr:hypothetical protein [Nocardioidaceae bacterium]
MKRHFKRRFWIEGVAASAAFVLLGLTLVWPSWIELGFGVDPDGGSGVLEWLIVLVSFMVLLGASLLAWREWRGSVRLSSPTAPVFGTAPSDLI